MAKMTDAKIREIVDGEFDQAMGRPGQDISKERAKMLEYYLSRPRGDEQEGETKIVTSEVADTINSVMPSLVKMFTTAENLVQFDPVDFEDTPIAEQASDYVSYSFFKRNDAFMILYTWFFDALVQKNGIVKCFWDKKKRVTTETYEGLTRDEYDELLLEDELEPVEEDERETDEGTLFDVKFKRTEENLDKVTVVNVPPEEFRISADARGPNTNDVRMVGHERKITRSELLAMGFKRKLVNELPEVGDERTTETVERKDKSDDTDEGNTDWASEEVLVREGYIQLDADDDGTAELLQVFTGGGKYMSHEEVDRDPFHILTPQPLPHKFFGRSMAEQVSDLQEQGTTFTRQIIMNLLHTNNPGHAVWEQGIGENTMDDLLTTRLGSVKRFARPVGESYAPMTVPFTARESFPLLEWIDKAKRDRTGVDSNAEGLDPASLKHVQQSALMQQLDQSRGKLELIARIFAETGIKSLFLHMHELILKHQQKAEIVRLRNEFVPIDPRSWRHRYDMTVNVGLGIGTREQNLLHLNNIWEKQSQMIEAGGLNLTVTPQQVYNTAAEMVKNANYKTPEMFFQDPGPDATAPPPSDEQQELERMQAEIEQRRQQLDAERQQIAQMKLQAENEKAGAQHQRELLKIQQDSAAKTGKLQVDAQRAQTELIKVMGELEQAKQGDPLDAAEKLARIQESIARTRQILGDTEATQVETEAVKSGVQDLLEATDGDAEDNE